MISYSKITEIFCVIDEFCKEYDQVVINDDLKTCYNNIINILDKEFNNKKSNYNKSSIKDHISKLI